MFWFSFDLVVLDSKMIENNEKIETLVLKIRCDECVLISMFVLIQLDFRNYGELLAIG